MIFNVLLSKTSKNTHFLPVFRCFMHLLTLTAHKYWACQN